jgi:hypothetical protein
MNFQSQFEILQNYASQMDLTRIPVEIPKFRQVIFPEFKYINCAQAAKENDFFVLKEMHQAGYPLCLNVTRYAVDNHNVEMLDYAIKHNCIIAQDLTARASKANSLDCIKYLVESGCIPSRIGWCPGTSLCAIRNNNLELLKYCIENGAQFDGGETSTATGHGCSIEMIKFLVEYGADKDENTILYLVQCKNANAGSVELLLYCIQQKFKLSYDVLTSAAAHKNYIFIPYLLSYGAEWNDTGLQWLAREGKIEALMKCIEYGAPIDKLTIYALTRSTRMRINFDNLEVRSFLFKLYNDYPEIRSGSIGKIIKEKMDVLQVKKETIIKDVSECVCDDIINYCMFDYISLKY